MCIWWHHACSDMYVCRQSLLQVSQDCFFIWFTCLESLMRAKRPSDPCICHHGSSLLPHASLTRIFAGFWGVLFQILVHHKTGHDLFSRKIFWPHIQRSDPLYMLQNCTLNCFCRRAHLHLSEDILNSSDVQL